MKKMQDTASPGHFVCRRMLILKTFLVILLWSTCLVSGYRGHAQERTTVTVNMTDVTLNEVITELKKQTKYDFFYNSELVKSKGRVSVRARNLDLREVLEQVLTPVGLEYAIQQDLITIRERRVQQEVAKIEMITVSGKVTDKDGNPVVGATVVIHGTTQGVATDVDGKYSLMTRPDDVLTISFIGYKTEVVPVKENKHLNVILSPASEDLEEVTVVAFGQQKKESVVSAITTVRPMDLKSSNSDLTSSFAGKIAGMVGWQTGGLPAALTEDEMNTKFYIRGITSFQTGANVDPLILLDGVESSKLDLARIAPEDIETFSVMKDASATAMYGARGANGVIVITTKEPEPGKLRFSYTGSLNLEVPDLSDYDVLNAREKLDLELRSGYYDNVRAEKEVALKQKYNEILQQVERGVNTYWLSKPLRVGIGHRHNIKLEGGDPSFRYSATAQYNDVAGVMKESFRRTFNGGINLSYKTSELIFRNQLTISLNKAQESPYGTFDEYVKLNPYWTATDENGNIKRFFDEDYEYWGGSYPANPLYNATLNTKETSDYTNITNNFSMEWKPIQEFTLRGTFGIYTQTSNTDNYLPPEHTSFADYTDENYFRRGSYDYSTNKSSRYNFSLTANYSKVFAEKHMVYAGLNMDLEDQRSRGYSFSVEGFPSGSLDFLSVAMQYKENGKPGGSESKSRRVGFVGNASYSFEDRYFVDASFRTDGSSLYGSDRRFAPFWSAGIGWNIHREGFMSDVDWINRLKIRASVGETGSNNFSSYEAMATYAYSLSDRYYNWMGANMKALANPDLEWQKTMKYNAGIEVNMLNNRLSMICDLYLERTNGLMSSLELPPSNGFSSYKANIGKLENKGFELKVTGYLLRDTERELIWSVTGSLVRNKDKIIELSEAMKEANATLLETGGATPNKIWQEGDSQNAIYAVRSLGIDPSNGRELFLKKNGEVTYTWDANDRVFCGVDQPDYRGNINTMFMWKDLSVNLSFGYEWGGQQYNSTLISRVENADKKYNVDRRVYEDRWKEPGDRTFFKGINETTATQATSRFVQDEATFTCQNLNVTYDLKGNKWLKRNLGIQTLTLKGDIADLFRISTIKQERGTSYPFSRQFSFTLSAMF